MPSITIIYLSSSLSNFNNDIYYTIFSIIISQVLYKRNIKPFYPQNFDRYRASKMVMDCLFIFDDPSMTRMSVAICSILAAKISTEQTTLLGTKRNMQVKTLGNIRGNNYGCFPLLQCPFTILNILQATECYIHRSSWYLFCSTRCKTGMHPCSD